MLDLKQSILQRKSSAENFLISKRLLWDEVEDLFFSRNPDLISGVTKSQVFDPKLSTLIIDRSARVMSQLAVGKVKPISKNDAFSAKIMNLLLEKYVVSNANAQFDFLTKLRMIDLYSNIYGNFFALVDWDIKPNGYVGPDLWLLNMRDVFPQVGATSIEDSDYIIVRSWRPLSYFESLLKDKGFKNVKFIVDKLKTIEGGKVGRDSNSKTKRETDTQTTAQGKGYYEVLSMYERDRWVDYVVEADEVFRDIPNPHDNGELPVVNKYSIPLLDDFMGMGDLERGKTMQYTLNSLWNLYLDGVKVSIFPPTLINKDYIADNTSIKFSPAAKWLVKSPGGVDQAARVMNLTPQGTNTFNNTYQVVNASIMSAMGTTDTSTSSSTDPGFGKSPQALQMISQRENARDNVDRFYMEQFIKNVYRKFVNLLAKKQTKNLSLLMFGEEMENLKKEYPQISDMYNDKTGKLSISKGKTGSILYDYEIVSGSTYAVDQRQQQQNLQALLGMIINPTTYQLIQTELQKEGKELKIGELFVRTISNSGITDWDKIVVDVAGGQPGTQDDQVLNQDAQQFQQILAQMGGPNGVPTNPQGQQLPQGGMNG